MKSFTAADIAEMLSFIPTRPDYDKWLRIASAVWSELPAGDGAMLLNQWSPEEQDGEYMAKHKTRLTRITIGSLVHYAKEGGWKGRRGAGRTISRNAPSSLRLTRTARNSRPIWLSPIKPKSPIVDVAEVDIVEHPPSCSSPHGSPPGRCSVCWNRWGRFLRENQCICTGVVIR